MDLLRAWFRRTFSDPQVVILGMFLLFFFAVVIWLGAYLAPVFASIIIAYLLEAVVLRLQRSRIPDEFPLLLYLGAEALLFLPDLFMRLALGALMLGLPLALLVAWRYPDIGGG